MSARIGLFASAVALMAAPLESATAAPPPPPPSYVADVAALLMHKQDVGAARQIANFIGDDVREYVNGRLIASGKADWLRHYATAMPPLGGLLGYSEGWKDGGSLMIVDQFDTIDRSSLPPGMVADPRYSTRTTLYQFGRDGKIHAIQSVVADGFWMRP